MLSFEWWFDYIYTIILILMLWLCYGIYKIIGIVIVLNVLLQWVPKQRPKTEWLFTVIEWVFF